MIQPKPFLFNMKVQFENKLFPQKGKKIFIYVDVIYEYLYLMENK